MGQLLLVRDQQRWISFHLPPFISSSLFFLEEHKLCFHQQFPAALNSRKQLAGELGGVHSAEEPDISPPHEKQSWKESEYWIKGARNTAPSGRANTQLPANTFADTILRVVFPSVSAGFRVARKQEIKHLCGLKGPVSEIWNINMTPDNYLLYRDMVE